jgi:prolyl 4-hydroxylase
MENIKLYIIIFFIIVLIAVIIYKNKSVKNIVPSESINDSNVNDNNKNVNHFTNDNKNKEIVNKEDFDIEKLYSNPDIFLIKNFLTEEECDHIIKIGEPHIKKSEVCGSGGSKPHKSRTSMTAHIGKKFLRNDKPDKILERVLEKSSIYGNLPTENIEPIQLVRYYPGQYFNKHYDYLDRNNPIYKKNIEKNGQREQTFFVYLNNVPDDLGGKTHFHKIDKTFQAKKGEAIFWRNMVDGKEDTNTLHSGTELKKGIKYGLNIWVREKKYLG